MPEVGNNLNIRYNFWNYLKLEITCLREFSAIAYYKIEWLDIINTIRVMASSAQLTKRVLPT